MEILYMIKAIRIRKKLRKKYNLSDDELNTYIIIKHHLDHIPTRTDLFKLEKI